MNRRSRLRSAHGLISILITLLAFLSCELTPRQKTLDGFVFTREDNWFLDRDYPGKIQGATVSVTLPSGLSPNSLVPSFNYRGENLILGRWDAELGDYSEQNLVSGEESANFQDARYLRVEARDGSSREYRLNLVIPPDALGLSRFYFDSQDNPSLETNHIIDAQIVGRNIRVILPDGISPDNLHPQIVTQNSQARLFFNGEPWPEGGQSVDFYQEHDWVVRIPGERERELNVDVRVQASDAKEMLTLSFPTILNPQLDQDYSMTITQDPPVISGTLPPGSRTLVPIFTISGVSATIDGSPFTSGQTGMDVENPSTITVTAYDGSSQSYTTNFTIENFNLGEIQSFSFQSRFNRGIEADVQATIPGSGDPIEITVNLPFEADPRYLFPSVSVNQGAALDPLPNIMSFESPVEFTVTAQSGETTSYQIVVNRQAADNSNTMSNFTIVGEDVAVSQGTYQGEEAFFVDMEVRDGTDLTKLFADFSISSKATVLPEPGYQDFSYNVLKYTVTAQSGEENEYFVVLRPNFPFSAQITSFSFQDLPGEGLFNENVITIRVPYGTDISSLTPVVEFTGTSMSPDSGVVQDFTGSAASPLDYLVTGENSASRTYGVRVVPSLENEAVVEGFWFLAQDNTSLAQDIRASRAGNSLYFQLPRDVDPTALIPRFSIAGQSLLLNSQDLISGLSDAFPNGTTIDLSNNLTFSIPSSSGETQFWSVQSSISTDSVPPVISDPNLSQSNTGATGFELIWEKARDRDDLGNLQNPATLQYKVVASLDPSDIDTIEEADAIKSSGGEKYLLMNWTPNVGNALITDLEPQTSYWVTVLVRDLDQNRSRYSSLEVTTSADPTRISSFGVTGAQEVTISQNTRTITFLIPVESLEGDDALDLSSLQVDITPSVPTSILDPASGSFQDFTQSPVPLTVTAEDGNVGVYQIFPVFSNSASKEIHHFSFPAIQAGGYHDSRNNNIAIEVSRNTDITSLVAEVLHTGTSISPDPAVPRDYTQPVEFTVSAEDGSSRTYRVQVSLSETGTLRVNVDLGGFAEDPELEFSPASLVLSIDQSVTVNSLFTGASMYYWYWDGRLLSQGTAVSALFLPAGQDPGFHDLTLVAMVDGQAFSASLPVEVTGL